MSIDRNNPPTQEDVQTFLASINFKLPIGFIEFLRETNGADINTEENYIVIWPVTEMIELNRQYNVNEYAPSFFLIGSDGGDTAYAIEKKTGYIFEMPFIGMSNEEAIKKYETFNELLKNS